MDYLQNITVSEFGKIKSNILSNFLTAMLCINAVAITMVVGMLDDGFEYPKNLGIAISVFACAGAVFLFFLLKRYMETITYRFYRVDSERLESIAKIARRFFAPFLISVSVDIVFACLGATTLLMSLITQAQ
jgi:predicted oxidoreductase